MDQTDFNNFFVNEASLGQSRAAVTVALLNELNDRVRGSALEKDPVELINTNIDYFQQFNVIIANNLPEDAVLRIAKVRTHTFLPRLPLLRASHFFFPYPFWCSLTMHSLVVCMGPQYCFLCYTSLGFYCIPPHCSS